MEGMSVKLIIERQSSRLNAVGRFCQDRSLEAATLNDRNVGSVPLCVLPVINYVVDINRMDYDFRHEKMQVLA